jgi:hypothetical protein
MVSGKKQVLLGNPHKVPCLLCLQQQVLSSELATPGPSDMGAPVATATT